MALSIRDKLFITLRWPIHGTRYTRSTGQTASGCGLPVGAARVAERASERASERTSEQRRERKRERESRGVDSQNQFSGFHLENITCFARCLWVPLGTCQPVIPRCIPIPPQERRHHHGDAAADTPIVEFDATFGDLGLSDTRS